MMIDQTKLLKVFKSPKFTDSDWFNVLMICDEPKLIDPRFKTPRIGIR